MSKNIKTQIYTNPSGLAHDMGEGHPECPERLKAVLSIFEEEPFKVLPVIEASQANLEWIARAHPEHYIKEIQDSVPDEGLSYIDMDTALCPSTWDAALTAAGANCRAVEDVMDDTCTRAFCAVRPPGHHAEPDRAMGFCFFNNIFIGALHAQAQYNLNRIVIIDFDVHHGNGSDTMARQHEGIFYISTHESGIFPGTGSRRNNIKNRIFNIPLPHGTGSQEFRSIYEDQVFPAINTYAPELIMISAGFDAHQNDPLAGTNLTAGDYYWVTEKLCALADKHCRGKVISTLEGGYNMEALKESASAHIKALAAL